jgi:hypothetical protein
VDQSNIAIRWIKNPTPKVIKYTRSKWG